MSQFIILIPALNPLSSFIDYVKKLKQYAHVLVVNDGSEAKYDEIFQQLQQLPHCTVLSHSKNLGKGRALKTGIAHILEHNLATQGVLTVGAHGQHDPEDVEFILTNTNIFSDGLILGTRSFSIEDAPILRTLQNNAATILFELFFRKRLLDFQTGLRYLPKRELGWLLHTAGENYDYDTQMLVEAINRRVPIYEVPIGRAKLRKNTIMQYDEINNGRIIVAQLWRLFLENRALK